MRKTYFVVITAVELNAHHGTGNFLRQICPETKGVVYHFFRAISIYNNICDVAGIHKVIPDNCKLGFVDYLKYKIFKPKVLVCPYFEKNIDFALYLKKHFNPVIITYLLDDQNIAVKKISNTNLRQLFRVSKKIYCISEEMQKAYNSKFKIKCEVLLPKLCKRSFYIANKYRFSKSAKTECCLIGNIWDNDRLNEILDICRTNKLRITWFGYGPDAPWLYIKIKKLKKSDIKIGGWLPEKQLFKKISQLPFVILPTGGNFIKDERKEITRFSLPSRLFFLGAHSNTPILVLGRKRSAVGNFVKKNNFGIAACTNHEIKTAIAKLKNKNIRQIICDNLLIKKDMFVDAHLVEKIWS